MACEKAFCSISFYRGWSDQTPIWRQSRRDSRRTFWCTYSNLNLVACTLIANQSGISSKLRLRQVQEFGTHWDMQKVPEGGTKAGFFVTVIDEDWLPSVGGLGPLQWPQHFTFIFNLFCYPFGKIDCSFSKQQFCNQEVCGRRVKGREW